MGFGGGGESMQKNGFKWGPAQKKKNAGKGGAE